jgi:hypothetical protein
VDRVVDVDGGRHGTGGGASWRVHVRTNATNL